MTRGQAHTLLIAVVAVLGVAIASAASNQPTRVVGYGQVQVNGHGPEWWWNRYRAERRLRQTLESRLETRASQLRETRRALHAAHAPTSSYAIHLAASVFGVPEAEMRAVASCETGGTFSPFAQNPTSTASGLFQFLDSTWASQGLAGFSVFDPVANALAAARIVSREGWRQWSCRP